MNSIILKSLETNSTTILPNFGAFMKMGKSVLFNEFLKYDDGKLAKVYASEKGIEEAVAKNEISKFIESVQKELSEGKEFKLEGLGTLSKVAGKIKFNATLKAEFPKATSETKEKSDTPKKKTPSQTKSVSKTAAKKVDKPKTDKKLSSDFLKDEAIAKIKSIKEKQELIDFTRGEKRKTVIEVLNKQLDSFNKKAVTPKVEEIKPKSKPSIVEVKSITPKSKPIEVKVEKPLESKVEPKKTEPKKEPQPIVEPTVVKIDPQPKTPKDIVVKEEAPKKEETKKPEPKPINEEPKKEIKPTKETVVKETTLSKDETKEKTPVETKNTQIESESVDPKAVAAISEGLEKTEQERKRRKRRKAVLWTGIICLLIGLSIFGYLKQDMIKGWFGMNGSEVVNNDTDNNETEKEETNKLNESENNSSSTLNEDSDAEAAQVSQEEDDEEITNDSETEAEEETDTNNEDKLAEESEEVEEIEASEPVITEETTPVVNSTGGDFHLVAGAYSTEENAEKKVKKLKAAGYLEAKVLGKFGSYYKVSVASYPSNEDAVNAKSELKEAGISSTVKKL